MDQTPVFESPFARVVLKKSCVELGGPKLSPGGPPLVSSPGHFVKSHITLRFSPFWSSLTICRAPPDVPLSARYRRRSKPHVRLPADGRPVAITVLMTLLPHV